MAKKIFLIVLIVILLLVAAFFIWRYVNYRQEDDPYKTFLLPKLEMYIVEVNSVSSEKSDVTSKLLIKNQFPFAFTADSFDYNLYMNDTKISESKYKKSFSLESNDSSWITVPVVVYLHDLDSVTQENAKRGIDTAEYRLQASFYAQKPIRKNFDVTIKRQLPLVYIPKVDVQGLDVDSLNFTRAFMIVHVDIDNGNVFPVKAREIGYEFKVHDHEWVHGKISVVTVIREKGITSLQIPVRLSFKEFGKTLFQLLKKGRNVDYDLRLTCFLESDNNMIQNSKVIINSSGTVKSLMKQRKDLKENL